eukprot:gene7611-9875_t
MASDNNYFDLKQKYLQQLVLQNWHGDNHCNAVLQRLQLPRVLREQTAIKNENVIVSTTMTNPATRAESIQDHQHQTNNNK